MTELLSWSQDLELTNHLVAISIKAILVLGFGAGLAFALRHASAAARHFVWTLAIAGVLSLPMLSLSLPVWRIAVLPSTHSMPNVVTENPNQIVPDSAFTGLHSTIAPSGSSVNEPTMLSERANTSSDLNGGSISAPAFARIGWIGWLLVMWFTVALLIIGRLLIGTASIWWIAHKAERVVDTRWLNAANDIAWQIGLMRPVRLLKTARLSMPVTSGLINSSILLPAEADEWPLERRQVVLVHELAHVKRRDCLTQMFAQIACAIYWFNPLVWLASRQLRIERERACDDQVIHIGTKASEYAGHLLEMARTFRASRCASLAAVAIARRSELEGRLLAILDPELKRRGLKRSVAASVLALLVLIIFPLATIRLTAKAQEYESSIEAEKTRASSAEYAASISLQTLVNTSATHASAVPHIVAEETEPVPDDQANENQQASGTAATTEQMKKSAIESVREALKDEDPEVRQHALFALTQVGEPEAVSTLIEALNDQNWQIRSKAAWGLGLKGGPKGVDALIRALKDGDFHVREQAAWGLGLNGDSRSVEPLIAALNDEHADVREKAAWALGLKGDRRSVEPLIAALKDSNAKTRAMAAWALGLKGDARAAGALKDLLKDPDSEVRKKAAWALGMLLMQRADSFVGDSASDKDDEASDGEVKSFGGVSVGVGRSFSRSTGGGVAAAGGNVFGRSWNVAGAGWFHSSDASEASRPGDRAKARNKAKQK
jgi:HEAT repeat protein/beta-lactamase regulating signal transducer with metallopeptidase domain